MNRHAVLISREWTGPEIRVSVTNEGIVIMMRLDEFMEAVVQEAGNPALLLTAGGLRKRLTAAAQTVVDKMKQETAKVM
jgi:hypothetical protein